MYDFLRKIFLVLYSISWPNFIVWLPLLLEILGNMGILIIKGDFTLDGMWAECRGDIAFFLFLHMRKSFVYSTFLKCRFHWKVGIISTFPLRTNVAFCFNQSFLCDHVNKVSHYNWVIHSPRYIMAAYFNLNNKFNMILGNQGRLVLSD